MYDPYRSRHDPARLIYDAILLEAEKRPATPVDVWIVRERENVWRVARDYAQQHGLTVLTMAEIEGVERSACGHVDYAEKWAYGVADRMRKIIAATAE